MTGDPDPLAIIPAELRARLESKLRQLPEGWQMTNPRPLAGGAWSVDLVTADGIDAGTLGVFPDTEEGNP